jgi:hypothetical protein
MVVFWYHAKENVMLISSPQPFCKLSLLIVYASVVSRIFVKLIQNSDEIIFLCGYGNNKWYFQRFKWFFILLKEKDLGGINVLAKTYIFVTTKFYKKKKSAELVVCTMSTYTTKNLIFTRKKSYLSGTKIASFLMRLLGHVDDYPEYQLNNNVSS